MNNPTLFIAFVIFVLAIAVALWQVKRRANRKAAERLSARTRDANSFVNPRYSGRTNYATPIRSPAAPPPPSRQDDDTAVALGMLMAGRASAGDSIPASLAPAFVSGGGGDFDGAGATGRWDTPSPSESAAPAPVEIGSCTAPTIEPAPSPTYEAPAPSPTYEAPAPSYSAPAESPAPSPAESPAPAPSSD